MELIEQAAIGQSLAPAGASDKKTIAEGDLAEVFGVEMDTANPASSAPPPAQEATPEPATDKAAKTQRRRPAAATRGKKPPKPRAAAHEGPVPTSPPVAMPNAAVPIANLARSDFTFGKDAMPRLTLVIVLGIVGCGNTMQTQPTPTSPAPTRIKVLAIGNSFTENTTRYLPDIARAAGCTLTLGKATIGGSPLATHWANALLAEKDPPDPKAKAYSYDGKPVTLKEILLARGGNVVVLQQHSLEGTKAQTYRPFARELADYIRKYAPGARVVLHQTWAYREDDPAFTASFTHAEMRRRLQSACRTVAGELGAEILPIGEAFENARIDPRWTGRFPDPAFDYAHPQYPRLPDQSHSLNVGYTWGQDKDGRWRLDYDGHHANPDGQYLGAAVWFEFLFGKSVMDNKFVPPELAPGDAAVLARIAHQTVHKTGE